MQGALILRGMGNKIREENEKGIVNKKKEFSGKKSRGTLSERIFMKGENKGYVDRKKVQDTFDRYVGKYNIEDEKIRLKAEHTYRVSELCQRIAEASDLSEEDTDLAWLLGMLHDVGRFEQVRRFGTFMDSQSVNHAEFGAELLFEDGLIKEFIDAEIPDMELLRNAVAWHSAYRLPENLDDRTKMFCDILRDADKVDILRVNVEFSFEDIYNVSLEELKQCEVTEEVMQAVREKHAVFRDLRKTPIDYLVGHICLVYELVHEEAVRAVVKQGYLDRLLNFQSDNEKTMMQFAEIRANMQEYLCRMI